MRNFLLAIALSGIALSIPVKVHPQTDPFNNDKLYSGYVCDASCSAVEKHSPCKDKCPAAGAKPVLVSGHKVLTIDNPEAIQKQDLGQRVQIRGSLTSDGSLHVDLLHRIVPGGEAYDGR